MMITAFFIVATLVVVANMMMEFKRVLMMLQQNSYRRERYVKWLNTSGDTTSTVRLIALIAFFASWIKFAPHNWWWGMGLMLVVSLWSLVMLCRARYKKPLVWTMRARRIYIVMLALAVVTNVIVVVLFPLQGVDSVFHAVTIASFTLFIASSAVVLASNWLLAPVERSINKRYYDDAARILASMPRLKVIGITGSYGKTSTKHYLYRILSEKYDVLMTPGSYNTTLGVVRTVREMLKPYNEVFIVEMGAKQRGDIKEICDLVHPAIGIVTAVGEQHLESFKTIENVQRTKFELVDSLPSDGFAVINDDFPYVANRPVSNVECTRYAVRTTGNARFSVKDIVYDSRGTRFTVTGPGVELELFTHLVGECNVSNLVAAVVVALHLEVPPAKIRYAVEQIEQVEHRLNLKRTAGGVTIIDDAFNSNPTGSGMALDVLAGMTGGKRIVVTPGMIELGDRQHELNYEFGRKIASAATLAIVVGEYNRDAIVSGCRDAGMPDDAVVTVATFADAQRELARVLANGDTVLYENDLPDTFK